jgi:hypothetical protein
MRIDPTAIFDAAADTVFIGGRAVVFRLDLLSYSRHEENASRTGQGPVACYVAPELHFAVFTAAVISMLTAMTAATQQARCCSEDRMALSLSNYYLHCNA